MVAVLSAFRIDFARRTDLCGKPVGNGYRQNKKRSCSLTPTLIWTFRSLPATSIPFCNAPKRPASVGSSQSAPRFNRVAPRFDFAEQYPEIYAVVGIHPTSVSEEREDFISELRKLADHPKVVAIGETGSGLSSFAEQSPKTGD